jgi:glutaredoxin
MTMVLEARTGQEEKIDLGLVIYSKYECPKCDALKARLTRFNVAYDEKNVEEDRDAMALLVSNGFKSAPVISYMGELIPGDRHDRVAEITLRAKALAR